MTWMRRGDCPAVFSLEILRRIPCTGEESAPREIGRGIQQISKQTDAAFRSRNTSAPRNGIFIQIPQGLARRGFKNQNPARGRKLHEMQDAIGYRDKQFKNQNPARGRKLSRRSSRKPPPHKQFKNQNPARGRKPVDILMRTVVFKLFKNQNPARGRKPSGFYFNAFSVLI